MAKEMRTLWTMSKHITTQYNAALQGTDGLIYITPHKHRKTILSRMERDYYVLQKIKGILVTYTPFSPDTSLKILL